MRTLLAVPAPLSPARRNAIVEAYLKGSEKAEIAFEGGADKHSIKNDWKI